MLSIAKKSLKEEIHKAILSSFRKTKSLQTSCSFFAEKIEQVKKTRFKLKTIERVEFLFNWL